MEKLIITGGRGFLGKRLETLLREKYDIFIFDKQDDRDVTRTKDFENLEADYVVHSAALTKSLDVKEMFNVNVYGTFNVLEFCKSINARLIFISSAAVYGNVKSPIREDTELNPISLYGLTKLIGEKSCEFYNKNYNLPITILRIFNLYGPEQQKGFVIPDLISKLKNEKIIINNSNHRRDFIHIDDAAEAIKRSIFLNTNFEIINIGSGKSYSIQELAEKIAKGKIIEPILSKEESDIYADISKAGEVLDWKPEKGLDEGLRKILKTEKIPHT